MSLNILRKKIDLKKLNALLTKSQKDWGDYKREQSLTKAEIAILLDEILDPFSNKIDLAGKEK